MKRLTFAWVTLWYDFDTEKEMQDFIIKWESKPFHKVDETSYQEDFGYIAKVMKPYKSNVYTGY